jgi:hypothetical protein
MQVRKAPRFEKLIASGRDLANQSVSLTFQDSAANNFEIELSLQSVPLSIFALANEQGRILSTLPAQERPSVQAIQGTGIRPALGEDGALALIFHLAGGGELTMEFPKTAISGLAQALTELASGADRNRYH